MPVGTKSVANGALSLNRKAHFSPFEDDQQPPPPPPLSRASSRQHQRHQQQMQQQMQDMQQMQQQMQDMQKMQQQTAMPGHPTGRIGIRNCGGVCGAGVGASGQQRTKTSALAKYNPAHTLSTSAGCAASSDQATNSTCSEPPQILQMPAMQDRPTLHNLQPQRRQQLRPQYQQPQQHRQQHQQRPECSPTACFDEDDGELDNSTGQDVDEDEASSIDGAGDAGEACSANSATNSAFVSAAATGAAAANNSHGATRMSLNRQQHPQQQQQQQQLQQQQQQQQLQQQQLQLQQLQRQQRHAMQLRCNPCQADIGCCGDEEDFMGGVGSDGNVSGPGYPRRGPKPTHSRAPQKHQQQLQQQLQQQHRPAMVTHSDPTSDLYAQSPQMRAAGKPTREQQQQKQQQLRQQQQLPQQQQQQQQNNGENKQVLIQQLVIQLVGCGECASCCRPTCGTQLIRAFHAGCSGGRQQTTAGSMPGLAAGGCGGGGGGGSGCSGGGGCVSGVGARGGVRRSIRDQQPQHQLLE